MSWVVIVVIGLAIMAAGGSQGWLVGAGMLLAVGYRAILVAVWRAGRGLGKRIWRSPGEHHAVRYEP